VASRFGISRIIDQVGETLTLVEVSTDSISDRGDVITSTTEREIKGYVDYMTGEEKVVEEGLLTTGDIIVFVDEDEDNTNYLVVGNYFVIDSVNYEIKNVIHNKGHYECHCKRK